MMFVAPLAGAWIETQYFHLKSSLLWEVAPLAGAWIETLCVDRKIREITSLPSRERGLKLKYRQQENYKVKSRSPRGSVHWN